MLSRRLRILFLASYFPKPDNSVMGTWALTQAQALVRQDIDLRVLSFTSWLPQRLAITSGAKAYANCPKEYVWSGGVKVYYPRWLYYPVPPMNQWAYSNPTPYLKLAWWSAKQEFCRHIEEFQPDVIFCHQSLPNGWMVAQLPAHLQKPLITLDHDFDEIADCRVYDRRKAAVQIVAGHAWATLAVAKRMENDLKSQFTTAKIDTLHNGVEPLPATTLKNERPSELAGKKVILTCALFAERKGVPLLIEAFAQIALKHPKAVLRIIGSGPEEKKIKDTIHRFNLSDQVQMIGKKNHAEVLQEMVWADCFALVGWDEPFATVYLEAMAAGKPIICCDDGGINDIIRDGVHGFTVPPKDVVMTAEALDRMLSNPVKRLEMGDNAQRLIHQKMTWDAKATELLTLLETAVVSQQQYATSM